MRKNASIWRNVGQADVFQAYDRRGSGGEAPATAFFFLIFR